MNWKTHIRQTTPKLSSEVYAIRCIFHLTNIDSLIIIHYAYFHSVLTYGIILCGSSTDIKRVFKLQKKAVRIMMGVTSRSSCRSIFKKIENPDSTSTIYVIINDLLCREF
jgi:hypothetical protein